MKKKFGKIMAIAAAVVICLSMAIGLVACGETPAPTIKEVYTSRATLVEIPESPQQLRSNNVTTVTLYSDGSYVLVDLQTSYMGAYGNSQVGPFTSVLYGPYTESTGEEEDTAVIKLAAPTRIVYNQDVTAAGSLHYDTADAASFETEEPDDDAMTAEKLLAKGKELDITVNTVSRKITAGITAGSVLGLFSF